jgi:polysaccharide biosynthesis protein PelF
MSMTEPHDVCLVLEGGRADQVGGVSTWVKGLLASAGDLSIAVARLETADRSHQAPSIDLGAIRTIDVQVGEGSAGELAAMLPAARCYHALSTSEAGEVALAATRANGARLLITEHGLAWREVTTGPAQLESGRRIVGDRDDVVTTARARAAHLLRAADRVTTVCNHNASAQWDLAGVRSQVIPNAIPIARKSADGTRGATTVRPDEQRVVHAPLVGLIGRVAALKDVLTFVRAAAMVNHPTAQFVVLGPLDDDEHHSTRCLDEAARLGLGGRLRFLGAQHIATWLPRLDLVVSSSISEAMPYALIEAMAHSIPVVATDVGGVADLVGRGADAAGLLSPARRPDVIAGHIDMLLSNPNLAAMFGSNGSRRLESAGTAESHWNTYHRLHRELAA